jgi:predicted oxidoreductase
MQDVLISDTLDGRCAFYLITAKGRAFMAPRLKAWGVEVEMLDGDLRVAYVVAKQTLSFYSHRGILRARLDQDVDIYYSKDAPIVVLLKARNMADEARRRDTAKVICDHFYPLINAAFATRDRKALATLMVDMPGTVERAVIQSRITHGADAFEEAKAPGWTFSDWMNLPD